MADWDVFHADRLEVERGLSSEAVRQGLAEGTIRHDDLIRPAGSSIPWAHLADFPALLEPEPQPRAKPAPEIPQRGLPPAFDDEIDDDPSFEVLDDDVALDAEIVDDEPEPPIPAGADLGRDDLDFADDPSILALPVTAKTLDEAEEEDFDPQEEDEAAAEFTLSRGATERVEELDLAAMVDVAFQLVLFFLVTATTVLYKSLEVPKPNPESPTPGVAQGHSRTLDDLKNDYILVEIDPGGSMKIDREPVASDMATLVERLRQTREKTGRKAMLLTADFATPHRNAVLAYDAANEIGLSIAIARPSGGG